MMNEDIEDLMCEKKRKILNDNANSKKKLRLTKSISHIFQHVPKSETLQECKCNMCEASESKENCSRNLNTTELMKAASSNSNIAADELLNSSDLLQMMSKPRTLRCSTLSTANNFSNKGHVFETKCEGRKLDPLQEINEKKMENSEKVQEIHGTKSSDQEMVSERHVMDALPVIAGDEPVKNEEKFEVLGDGVNEFDGLLDDWDLESAFFEKCFQDMDLSKWQRCEVVQVHEEIQSRNKVTLLRSLNDNTTVKCVLRGVWTSHNIIPGTIVNVKAHYDSSLSVWTVDNNNGFFIEYPDLLISPTTVVGSVSCLRQGILNFLFSKKLQIEENSKILATGSLIHELLQQIMSQGTESPECVATLIEEIISSSCNIRLLYSCKMSLSDAREELLKAVPQIEKFCKRYSFGERNKQPSNTQKEIVSAQNAESDAWEGHIMSVVAVEDNYWVPQLGLKGKIDITVVAKEKGQLENQIMPVELKTGVAKNSIEHRGQVILYNLMASQITPGVSGGLLLYLREGFARKIEVGRPEQRDIIMLRNRLAQYLTPFSPVSKELCFPHPTNNSRICEWCPQKVVCSAFHSASGQEIVQTSAQELRNASISHLKQEHIDYVVHWSKLLWLEEKDKPKTTLTDLWTLPAEKRETKGQCLCNLKLNGPVRFKDIGSYFHDFKRNNGSKIDLSSCQFSLGSVVIVSTESRIAIAFGIVEELNDCSIAVDVARDLSQVSNIYGDSFSVDIYEPQSTFHSILGNLAALLDNVESSANLRRLVIDRDLPLFDSTYKHSIELNSISQFTLNDTQCEAIRKALGAQDFLIWKGLPGSGKSSTIAILIQQFVSRGNSVLLTANTHSAVDTVLLKLLKLDVPFLRIGSQGRVHEAVRPWTEYNLTKHCFTPEQLDETYNKQNVVATTCLGVKHSLFTRRLFDVCIVDESTQVLQPVILGPLLLAKKFILVGDQEQLSPVVRSSIASEKGLSKCLFTHLNKPEATVSLNLQYRMNGKITDLANNLTYDGELKCATTAVSEATLQLNAEKIQDSIPSWSLKALSCKIEDSVVFIDIPCTQKKVQDCINENEALAVKKLIEIFLQADVSPDSIGVMATYRNQVKYIKSIMKDAPGIEISTVDQYQGRDKDVVIFSCTNFWSTANATSLDTCILNDKRRLTVAITRARFKLIIIGNCSALQCFSPLKHIINFIGSLNIVRIPDSLEGIIADSI